VCTCSPGYAGANCEACAEGFQDYGDAACRLVGKCSELQVKAQLKLDQLRASGNYPGVTLGIQTPECGTWVGASGWAITGFPGTRMTPEHIMSIGSNTKVFVSAVVLQLVEEGMLSLEDTLSRWRTDVPNAEAITIRQMLNHRSGIVDFGDTPCWQNIWNVPTTPDEVIACVLTQVPYFAPGADFHYSSTNYLLLGLIIEAVTGHELHDEIRARLLDPLGLDHTSFEGDDLAQPRAHYYANGQDVTGNYIHPTVVFGSGDMISSAQDMLVWIRSLLGGDVLSPQSLAEMQDFGVSDMYPNNVCGYGLGLETRVAEDADGNALFELRGHSGLVNGMSSVYTIPSKGATVAIITNQTWDNTHDGYVFLYAFDAMLGELMDLL
jgi:D-alanyl-D-alanine carboxypeptidase